ncbi:MAG: HEAT repeat domain-containing protein [Candidatus Thorarchaeota archaeon]
MSWENFLEAVHAADYVKSTRILSEALGTPLMSEIVASIWNAVEQDDENPLPFRDHIFHFLDITALYHGVKIPSYAILEKFLSVKKGEIKSRVFEWMLSLIESSSPLLEQYLLDVEDLSNSDFIVVVPDILERRMNELDQTKVHWFTYQIDGQDVTNYMIDGIRETAYGRQILQVLNVDPQSNYVGPSLWEEIQATLSEVGYNVDAMLSQVDEGTWYELSTKESSRIALTNKSSELDSLAKCAFAYLLLDSPRQQDRLMALEIIKDLETGSCNRKVMSLARDGPIIEQVKSLEILSSTGGPVEEDFLSDLLNDSTPYLKNHVAKSLSKMVSRGFVHSVSRGDLISTPRSMISRNQTDSALKKLMDVLNSRDRHVRIDAARTLARMNTAESEQILYKLVGDRDPLVRLELIELIPSLSPEFATVMITEALRDPAIAVRSSAIKMGKKIWPEQDWPEI